MKKTLLAILVSGSVFLAAQEINFPFPSRLVFNSDFSGNHELYLLQNNQLTRLTSHPAWDEYPVASHSGDRVVFTSDRSGNFDIYVLDLQTMALQRMTGDPREERDPSWSSDDRFIHYIVKNESNEWIPMKQNVATGHASRLFPSVEFPSVITPFQNRAGTAYFFTAKTLLGWLVAKFDARSGRFIRLTERGTCRPKISPDDLRVSFVSSADDGLGDVWLMNQDGTGKRNLTPLRKDTYDYYPAFSPDGQWLAFSSSPKKSGKSAYDIYLLHLASGKVTPIFRSSGSDVYPYWFAPK